MSQNDMVISNQSAPAFRADLNSALQALASVSSGATEPATKYANQLWYDTGTNTLKKRNEANSAWIEMGTFDEGAGTFTPTGTPPVQTQTTWDTGTSTTESVISPAKLKGAIDNSVADLAEGATGAPRIQTAALAPPAAGTAHLIMRLQETEVSTVTNTYYSVGLHNRANEENHLGVTCLVSGTITAYFEHRKEGIAIANTSYARILKNGSEVGAWSTTSTSFVARSLNISVSVGDVIIFQHKSAGDTACWRYLRIYSNNPDFAVA